MELNNARWELYAQARAGGKNQTESAIFAGYSKKSAHTQGNRLNKNEKVRERIKEIRKEKVEELGLDEYYVLKGIKGTIEDLDCAHQVRLNGYFKLGDWLGLWDKKDEEKIDILENMTDDELDEQIKKLKGAEEDDKEEE